MPLGQNDFTLAQKSGYDSDSHGGQPSRQRAQSVKKVNTSVQCETRIEELDRVEDYYVSEMNQSDARMSVSI